MNKALETVTWFKNRRVKSLAKMGEDIQGLREKWEEMSEVEREKEERKMATKVYTVKSFFVQEVIKTFKGLFGGIWKGLACVLVFGVVWPIKMILAYPAYILSMGLKIEERYDNDWFGLGTLLVISLALETGAVVGLFVTSFIGLLPMILLPSIRVAQLITTLWYQRAKQEYAKVNSLNE